ncbi:ATP-binding protein [Micromonospora sp. NPDC005710]|uniref:ATP-binding protein n=1 Tax=Micromonospora sp. NPDC005710 TaxID=3157051 RepID=UPI0033EB64B5
MRVSTTLSLPRHPSTSAHARRVLTTLLSLTEVSEDVRANLAVLMSEACANAVIHADSDSDVDVTISLDDQVCLIEVGNRGRSPDNDRLDADLPAPLTVGGRGLPLIGALADTAAFVSGTPGRVLLRITKHLADVPAAPTR